MCNYEYFCLKPFGMNIVFFKRPKPRQFNYTPIYYDPAKEAAEDRKKAMNSLQAGDPREHMRAEIKRKWKVERKGADKKNQAFRIFFYFIFAVFAIYLIFFTDMVNKLVSLFLR
jgi:hypothetical protein